MKKQLLPIAILNAIAFTTIAQTTIIDTVSTGAGYANQKWYSLQNDEQGTLQTKDNWDIAFEITGYSASILANTQKANFMVYKTPYSIANFNTIDTTGINNWKPLYNSDTTWAIGAFNKGGVFANPNYLGWGVYDMNTHIISGDSCYVIKLSTSSFKKFKIDNLSGGVYNCTYADINGANTQTIAINKSNYTGKNFAYYNLTTNTAIDREPISANWDLTFVKYTTFIPTPYGVTGILNNKGVTVAQADNVLNSTTYSNWSAHPQKTTINTIGYDWKGFTGSTYIVTQDTVYFVKPKQGDIWKLSFTGFGGSSNGNYILSKQKLSSIGIYELNNTKIASLTMYPNPTTQDVVNIIYDVQTKSNQVTLNVYDITGKEIYSSELNSTQGLYNYIINTANYTKGIYIINLNVDGKVASQKLIKE